MICAAAQVKFISFQEICSNKVVSLYGASPTACSQVVS